MVDDGRRTRRADASRLVAIVGAVALVVGLTACQPQTLDQTPSVCRATIAGSYRNGDLTSGRDRATLRFPQGAEVRVTGTVTNIESVFGAVLPWSLSPVASGTTAEGVTTNVDQTYTYSGSGEDIELVFRDSALFGLDFDWDLHLSATANGCPPSTPTSCVGAGGNFFFEEPVVIDGVQREGCFKIESCIDDLVAELSELDCDEDDVLNQLGEDGDGILVILGGAVVWATRPANLAIGSRILGGLTIVGTILVVGYLVYVVVDNLQGDQAIQERPDLVQDVVTNNPAVGDANPGLQTDPDFEARLRLAMATCIADIVISEVIEAAADFGLPTSIDPVSGLVTILGEVKHICELIPVYMPGGSTHAGGAPMQEATFHIRDVVYGERNRAQNFSPADPQAAWPSLPQPAWQVLSRGTSHGSWYAGSAYGCSGSATPAPPTACDEYPWNSSAQGGPGAHLRIIVAAHNSNGGTDWNSFMSGTACSISIGDSFAVVPLESEQIAAGDRSIRFCS